ncbi:hypothetical protein ABN224_16760 [Providencia rettgeri]
MSKCKSLKLTIALFSLFPYIASADVPYIYNNIAESRERIQNGDLTCESSKPQATINAGLYGNKGSKYYYKDEDKGGFIGISIPIGENSKVDCNKIYELTVRQKELQIKQLESQLADIQRNNELQNKRGLNVE